MAYADPTCAEEAVLPQSRGRLVQDALCIDALPWNLYISDSDCSAVVLLHWLHDSQCLQREVLIIAEVPRKNPEEDSQQLGERARLLQRAGVHALSVRTDQDDTPSGLRDLFSVVQSAQQVPVFRRDWFIHPLQVRPLLGTAAATSCTLSTVCR